MNRPRRAIRSPPPLGYDPRMMAGGGGNGTSGGPNRNDHHQRPPPPDYEDLPYAPGPTFEPQPPSQPPQAYVEPSNHHLSQPQQYSIGSGSAGYRDHRLPSTYRATLQQREPPPNLYNQTSKSANAPPPPPVTYKILCITNISHKVSDNIVKDALTSDFCRFGDISVSICHDNGERLAYIYFRTYEEAREARHVKSRTILFDRPIEIEPIFEPNKPSPSGSPPLTQQTPQYARRRSITPPDYYSINGPPQPPPHHAPPMRRHLTSNQLAPHQSLSPPNYPHHVSSRYPQASIPPVAPASYGRHYISPQAHLPPPSPYNSPPHPDPYYHRSYGSHLPPPPPHANPFPSTGHSYHHHHHHHPPPYGHPPPSRDHRDSSHIVRSPHREDVYCPLDQRSYPFPPSRSSSSSVHSSHHIGHSNILPNFHHQTPANRRSPPPQPHPMHPRYMSRDFRREKFGIRDGIGINELEDGKPSRVLFITNIDSSKSEADIRDTFEPFGVIEDIEMKKISTDVASALIKFSSMDCAYKAKTATNGKYLGTIKCRIFYGKVSTSRRLWIGGLSPATTLARLEDEFGKFGNIVNLDYISGRPYAYIEYESANQAQFATHHLKGTLAADSDRRIRIEFVDTVDRNIDKTTPSTRHDSSSVQISDISSRSRTTNESWSTNEHDEASPQLNNLKRRSISPSDVNNKRVALNNQSLSDHRANVLKSSSARSSSSSPTNEAEKTNREDSNELNNNSESNIENNDSAVIERTPSDNPNESSIVDKMAQSKSIREIVDCCSISWFCQLVLRNFNFPSKMYMCSGQTTTIEKYITKLNGENGGADQCPPILRITQRWRLHPQPKLEEVKRRMQTGNLGMLIFTSTPEQSPILSSPICKTPQSSTSQTQAKQNGGDDTSQALSSIAGEQHSTADVEGSSGGGGCGEKVATQQTESGSESSTTQSRPLKNLISYLEQKDAAGVISLTALDHNDKNGGGASDGSSKLLYAFPPGDFALNLLKQKASNLSPDVLREEFLLGVIVGGAEANKI